MNPLERGQLRLMRVHAIGRAIVLLIAGGAAETAIRTRFGLPPGIVLVPLTLPVAYAVFVSPGRRYRAWGYALGADELCVAYGVWTRVETHVPLARVQHVDVSQGPLERAFGVCRLILHTAGTANSRVVLPGLARATAEGLRDEARARIRQEDA